MSTEFGFNTVHDLEEANRLVKAKYGEAAFLEQFERNDEPRFRFRGVEVIARYPSYGFKSVTGAMNGLLAHEKGLLGEKDYQKHPEPKTEIEAVAKEMRPPTDEMNRLWSLYVAVLDRIEWLEKFILR